METINIRLAAFEGPLDLLYHLIEKNEIDIYDIPIAALTEQYLAYLDAAEDRDMDADGRHERHERIFADGGNAA